MGTARSEQWSKGQVFNLNMFDRHPERQSKIDCPPPGVLSGACERKREGAVEGRLAAEFPAAGCSGCLDAG